MRRLMYIIAKMPFSGKFAVADEVAKVVSSTTASERRKNTRSCLALLTFFIICHALQIDMGAIAMIDAPKLVMRVYGGLYMLANLSVTLMQMDLFGRVVVFAIEYRGRYRREGSERFRIKFSEFDHRFSVIFTFAAQILMIIIYFSML